MCITVGIPSRLHRMQKLVEANRPVVAAPYPKKHLRLKLPSGEQGYEPTWYPMGERDGDFIPALVPMGCTLIERSVVERVSRECAAAFERRAHTLDSLNHMVFGEDPQLLDDLRQAVRDGATCFGDVVDNCIVPHIFGPITGDNPREPSHPPNAWPEDMSFCIRCNRLGIPTVMHMGTEAYHHEGGVMFPMKEGR